MQATLSNRPLNLFLLLLAYVVTGCHVGAGSIGSTSVANSAATASSANKPRSTSTSSTSTSASKSANTSNANAPGSLVPLTIGDEAPLLQFSASGYTANQRAGWIAIMIDRGGSPHGGIKVSYATVDGSAKAGTAYGTGSGTLSWSDGDTTSNPITVPILDQRLTSGSQTFSVQLSSPSGASLGTPANATVTIVDSDALTVDTCQPNLPGNDATTTFCATPNFPIFGMPGLALPANPNAAVGDGLLLVPSATNLFSVVMGTNTTGANMVSGQSVRDAFYMNYIVGNLSSPFGSPADTGQANNSTFAAVARHYEVGDPNDVHLMSDDGLHLRAICSKNHTDCSPGNVYAGMIRVPAEIRPGMTIKVRYKSPAGAHSWAPIWMYSGSEYSPGPGGNPYKDFGTTATLVRLGSAGHSFEIDLNDNYPRWDAPVGTQLDYGAPNIYNVTWNTPPHPVYWATGGGYTYQTGSSPAFEQVAVNWSAGFHNLVLSWETDNHLYEFVDGKLVVASYMEYPALSYVDALDGNVTKTVAMTLMIGNQAIASFTPGSSSAQENDGIPDGWTIAVQEISVWNGTVVNPNSYQAASNGCNSVCQQE